MKLNFISLNCSRSVTKEEKEKENTRKVAPTMPPAGRPSSVQTKPIHEILSDDLKAVSSPKKKKLNNFYLEKISNFHFMLVFIFYFHISESKVSFLFL